MGRARKCVLDGPGSQSTEELKTKYIILKENKCLNFGPGKRQRMHCEGPRMSNDIWQNVHKTKGPIMHSSNRGQNVEKSESTNE